MKFKTKTLDLEADALAVFERLAGEHDYCFLLETLADEEQPETTTQSYLGIAPEHRYVARDDVLYADEQAEAGDAYAALRRHINFDQTLPPGYVGGLVGYFSHEAIRYAEPSLTFAYEREFPDFEFGLYNDGLIFQPGQAPRYFHYGADRSKLYQAARHQPGGRLSLEFVGAAKELPDYERMIRKARDDIQNGRVFQVVVANKYEYRVQGNLLALYRELRRINPSPFMFFMKFGDIVTLGASPELLVHSDPGGRVHLEALAGTIRRGQDAAGDERLARQLLADEKEVAEHSMLVDLARNDVGRVSRIGSVQIDKLMYVKRLSHVQHISSLVSGQLAADRDAFDALTASFPAGTLSGAPKIEAIKMISELEGYERGPYGGTIGYFSYNGDAMHAVNIRSVSAAGAKLLLHSGSGIVYDSRASREYQEVSDKKAAMDRAMGPFLGGGAP